MTLPDPRRDPDPRADLRIGDAERHQVAEILREAAGEGRLDLEELDERLEATYAAKTYADLVPLTLDLPLHGPTPAPAAPATPDRAPLPPGSPATTHRETHLAILSGFDRKGVWTVPGHLTVVAVMGGADLDLRQARFTQRESTIVVTAVMGGVQITVGPEVQVVMEVVGIMGGASGPSGGEEVRPDAPILRVKGVALMGGVDVRRKQPPSVTKGGRQERR